MSFPCPLTVDSAITLGALQQLQVYCQFTGQEAEAQKKEM